MDRPAQGNPQHLPIRLPAPSAISCSSQARDGRIENPRAWPDPDPCLDDFPPWRTKRRLPVRGTLHRKELRSGRPAAPRHSRSPGPIVTGGSRSVFERLRAFAPLRPSRVRQVRGTGPQRASQGGTGPPLRRGTTRAKETRSGFALARCSFPVRQSGMRPRTKWKARSPVSPIPEEWSGCSPWWKWLKSECWSSPSTS